MSNKYGRERLLIIDGELAEEEQKQEIQYQLYHDCYMYALRSILKDTLWKIETPQEETEPLYPREVNNIISFIGDRGTGKTTVLREFCWLLQNLRSSRKNSWINNMPLDEEAKERLLRTEINFTVLSPIDASLLEEKEDLFELILAGLFEKCEEYWRGGSYTYENRCSETREKLLKKFGEVYRNHRSVKQGDRQEDAGESVVTRLRTMASSKKIQTAFGELIDSFFHLIEGENLNQAVDYLIVVIDDLDLNLEHGFQMLEELQKYLTHPNVIILTALSYKQLSLITESHFIKNLGHSAGGRNTEELALHCRELAKDYLDKLIPVSNRIYMPDIYTKSQDIEIRNDNEKQSIQAKKYIMLKNAEKMHIYYDGLGIKKHFVEKRTVRTLLSSVEFLNSLATVDFSEARMIKGKVPYGVSEKNYENIRKLQRGLVRAYGRNYERYNADIQERMIFEKTDEQQRRFFDDLMGIQLTRRGRYVAALKAENFKSLALNGNALSIPYNYGDLLECIHTWGRKREQDKPLIHCIMASFTSEMVHECICYMYSPDETKRNKSRRKLEHFLGEGFGNDWIGKMLPVRMLEKIEFIAFFRAVEFQMINCYFPLERLYTLLKHLEPVSYSMDEKTWEEKIIKEIGEAVAKDFEENKAIWSLQCMDMLFENACLNQQQMPALSFSFNIFERTFISLSKNTSQPHRKGLVLQVGIDTQQADLDILGFIKKSIATQEEQREKYKKIFEDISAAISKYVAEYVRFENAVGIEEKLTKKLTAQLKKQSIFEKIKAENTIAFPFYDFDLSYNIIKRVRDKCSRSFTQPTLLQDIVKNIVKIYGFIEEELATEENYYAENNPGSIFPYSRMFSEYPYIAAMKKLKDNELFARILQDNIKAGISPSIPETEIND